MSARNVWNTGKQKADKRFRFLRSEAVVLRSTPFAEADRLVTFYTKQYGKLKAVAKGARRPTCRFAGVVEPSTHAAFYFYRKPTKDLALMTQHQVIRSFRSLRSDLDRYLQTCYLLELVDRCTPMEEMNEAIWNMLLHVLERFQHLGGKAPLWLACFEVRMLSIMGYHVRVGSCTVCQRELKGEACVFDPAAVGMCCPRCVDREEQDWWVSPEAVKLLQDLQAASFEEMERLEARSEDIGAVRGILLPLLHRFSETPHEFRTLTVARALM